MSQYTHFFGNFWVKKVFFCCQKECFLCKKCKMTWFKKPIILSLNCNFAITRKNDAFVTKKVSMRLTDVFIVIFALAERLPTSAILVYTLIHTLFLCLDELLNIVLDCSAILCQDLLGENCFLLSVKRGGDRSSQLLMYWS